MGRAALNAWQSRQAGVWRCSDPSQMASRKSEQRSARRHSAVTWARQWSAALCGSAVTGEPDRTSHIDWLIGPRCTAHRHLRRYSGECLTVSAIGRARLYGRIAQSTPVTADFKAAERGKYISKPPAGAVPFLFSILSLSLILSLNLRSYLDFRGRKEKERVRQTNCINYKCRYIYGSV